MRSQGGFERGGMYGYGRDQSQNQRGFSQYERDDTQGYGGSRMGDYGQSGRSAGRFGDDYAGQSSAVTRSIGGVQGSRGEDDDHDPHFSRYRDEHLSRFDSHYGDRRREQEQQLRSDYQLWRSEQQNKWNTDFQSWREKRLSKPEGAETGESATTAASRKTSSAAGATSTQDDSTSGRK